MASVERDRDEKLVRPGTFENERADVSHRACFCVVLRVLCVLPDESVCAMCVCMGDGVNIKRRSYARSQSARRDSRGRGCVACMLWDMWHVYLT